MKKISKEILFLLSIQTYFIMAGLIFNYNPTNYENFNFLGYILIESLAIIALFNNGKNNFNT